MARSDYNVVSDLINRLTDTERKDLIEGIMRIERATSRDMALTMLAAVRSHMHTMRLDTEHVDALVHQIEAYKP